jgi:two-component system, OmpR family, sensor kinase
MPVTSSRPRGSPASPDLAGRSRWAPTWWARLRTRIHRTQLRTRVLTGVLAVTLIALAGFGFAAVTALHGYLLAATDADLHTVIRQYQPLLATPSAPQRNSSPRLPEGNPRGGNSGGKHLRLPTVLDKYDIEFVNSHGLVGIVGGNADLVPQLPANLAALAADGRGQTVTSNNGHAQLRLVAKSANGKTLIVTANIESLNNTVSRLNLIIAVGVFATALLVFGGVSLVVRRGLRPVERMASAADKITAGDLTSRVSPNDPATEVGRLGVALNGMLARIQDDVHEREATEQATRQFFADASHELRTPLASLRANAELYQQGALQNRAQVDEAMHRISSEARRMGILVDDLLRLARLDQHPQQHHVPLDLSALAEECLDRARTAHPRRTWHSRVKPGLVVNGDEEMLRRAIDNLLANVTTHTPDGTEATITVAECAGSVTVEVSDDGPGLPASQLPRIFDRFYRVRAQMSRPGSGLGLAIVAAIAAAHHGAAEATLNQPHGLRVTLTLPAYRRPGSAGPPAGSPPGRPSPAPQPEPASGIQPYWSWVQLVWSEGSGAECVLALCCAGV